MSIRTSNQKEESSRYSEKTKSSTFGSFRILKAAGLCNR